MYEHALVCIIYIYMCVGTLYVTLHHYCTFTGVGCGSSGRGFHVTLKVLIVVVRIEACRYTQSYLAGGTPETCMPPFDARNAPLGWIACPASSDRVSTFGARFGWNPLREASGGEAKTWVNIFLSIFLWAWNTQ